MIDLALTSTVVDDRSLTVGYTCPCGCTPSVTYARGNAAATEGCCCGNEVAVGPDAAARVSLREGFELRLASVTAPWRDVVPVAWAIGPSTHPVEPHEHTDASTSSDASDPVCGMVVVPATAIEKGLHVAHQGIDYYFCGKGCKLEFTDDPQRFLDPAYVPSM
jgi:YHS domain-containing protein